MAPINARSPLHPWWTKHQVPVVRGFMLAEIKVIRKQPGNVQPKWNYETGQYEGGIVNTVWTGAARIQPYGIIGDMVVGQDTTGRRLMRVQIEDKEANIQLDDIVIVETCEDDPELVHYQLEVRGAIGSSNAWIRDLVCEANLKGGAA